MLIGGLVENDGITAPPDGRIEVYGIRFVQAPSPCEFESHTHQLAHYETQQTL